ncbi:MAG: HAD hydrolase-like protein [Lachnospiraceae bacterium]|nr:HAD hydrolase-like protein [Candidatus Merdinaster equi]
MKAILFDLDGTLIDSSEGITKSVQYSLDFFGIHETDLDKLRVFIGPPLKFSYPKHYGFEGDSLREVIAKYRERYTQIGLFECTLYPGVRECITRLKENGFKICLASSKPEVMCKTLLEHFEILDLFDEVAGASLDGKIDTKKQVLDELFRRLPDIATSEMVLVGDTIYDVEGARAAGIPTIAVDYGFGEVQDLKDAGAITILSSLGDVASYILSTYK